MAKGFKMGGGGGAPLNFKVVGGTSAPSNPKENTIWVNTDSAITGWHFGAEEPNVYDIKTLSENDPHVLIAPHRLSEGDIFNFEIPETVDGTFEALRIRDTSTGKEYCVRGSTGEAVPGWYKGIKLCVFISNDIYPIGSWAGQGTAIWMTWGSYYHKEGTVWIQTGTTSPVAMNVLKKNSIQVCPLNAKQYVGGAWVAKEAKTYQGGAWVDWIHTDIAKIYNLTEVRENGTGGATVVVGKEIVLTSTSGDSSSQGYVAFYSEEKIDVTNCKTLTFKGFRSSFGQGFLVGFRTGNTRYWHWGEHGNDIIASAKVDTTEKTYNVDISSLSGSYYFFINFAGEASAGTASMKLSDFELT